MKKILSLMAAVAAVLTFPPAETQAGDISRSRIHSRCGHCGHNILAFYRPVRFISALSVYGWVPSYHGSCGSAYGLRGAAAESNLRYSYGAPNRHNYGSGYVRRTVPSVGIHRNYLSGRTISVYPGWRHSGLNRYR